MFFIRTSSFPLLAPILSRKGELSGGTLRRLSRVSGVQLSEKGTKIRQQDGLVTPRAWAYAFEQARHMLKLWGHYRPMKRTCPSQHWTKAAGSEA